MKKNHTRQNTLISSSKYQNAKKLFLDVILEESKKITSIQPPSSDEIKIQYKELVQDLGKMKGREQYFQYLSSGIGQGPFIELLDGSVKMDLITGIGINFFGHTHAELLSEILDAASSDTMQGNLQPGYEAEELIRTLLKHVGKKSRLEHAWLLCSGTMANETALKIIRQKKFPATKIFAFGDCFAGRSTAMQEITDSPKYREGQPTYGEVSYLPFYDPKLTLDQNTDAVLKKMKEEVDRYPGKYAGLMIELIQGEGGIRFAPREWYVRVFEGAKKYNLALWFDEIQTFGRTEQLFAYQTFGLEEYADVVTIGKLLHACAALYTPEYNPRAGLVAGTFTGSNAALKTGRRILDKLTTENYYGPEGKISKLSQHFGRRLNDLKSGNCKNHIGEIRIHGGLVGFGVWGQTLEDTKKFLMNLFDAGIVAFYAGHDPYIIRLLPPFGVMTESHIDQAIQVIEHVLLQEKK